MSSNFLETDMWNDRDFIDEQPVEEQDEIFAYEEPEQIQEEASYEDTAEETIEENTDDEQDIVNNARTRLEQGRLYEMLINHNLFDGVNADPKAVSRVEKEIKEFITERLEILLGMRAEKERIEREVGYQSPFNDVEVQALKMMAATVTKGASSKAEPTKTQQPIQKPSALNTVKQKKEETRTLNTVSAPKSQPKPQPQSKPQPQPKVVARQAPPQNNVVSQKIKKAASSTTKTASNVDSAAKNDIKYLDSLKQLSLEEANKVVSERHKRPAATLSNITQETINSHYTNKTALSENANFWAGVLKKAKTVSGEE
jgi:hypothetical protein